MNKMLQKLVRIKKINISQKVKKEIVRYAISFFFAWLVSALISDFPYFREHLIKSVGLDQDLTRLMVSSTEMVLNSLGFMTYSEGRFLRIIGTPGIEIAYGCLGFRELAFFVVFVLLQYGSWKNKIWYIPLGVILLIMLNIFRAVIITIGQYNSPEDTQLIHDIVSPILMYPAIFFLWIFWLTKYGKQK